MSDALRDALWQLAQGVREEFQSHCGPIEESIGLPFAVEKRVQAAYDRIRELEAQQAASDEKFTAWLCEQMPHGTVIGDPKWWTPKILRAVRAFAEVPAPVAASEPVVYVLLHTSGYCHTDVEPIGVFLSENEAKQAQAAHEEPGNCLVTSSPLYAHLRAAAVTDTQRLDWLEKRITKNFLRTREVILCWDHEDGYWIKEPSEPTTYADILSAEDRSQSLRDAIDSAMGTAASEGASDVEA